jgi:preprotein translocase subunit SecB
MAEKNGKVVPAANDTTADPVVRLVAQYIKDLSMENPNIDKMVAGPAGQPNIKIDVDAKARQMPQPGLYESVIELNVRASSPVGVIYDLEIVYGGLFEIRGMPEPMMEQFLLINGPMLMFPFVRRIVADLSREGGYPALMLDPIDFGRLYAERGKIKPAGTPDTRSLS